MLSTAARVARLTMFRLSVASNRVLLVSTSRACRHRIFRVALVSPTEARMTARETSSLPPLARFFDRHVVTLSFGSDSEMAF